ncbi:adenosylhomocysteinase, partial [Actinomycetospora sp. NBRC 106375]
MTTTTVNEKFAEKNGIDFAVADLAEADFGRREIRLAEHEMPGLMAL